MSIQKENKKIYDISVPLSNQTPVWEGSRTFSVERVKNIEKGAICNVTEVYMDLHTGTHIDAPLHFIENGKPTSKIPLDDMIGECLVLEIYNRSRIFASDLEILNIPSHIKKILIKTENSKLWNQHNGFYKDFCALNKCAAEWFVHRKIKLVGIDYLSIQKYQDGPEVHQILLKNDIIIVEGLNLTNITPAYYELICLPLAIEDVEGASARVILRDL